MSWEKNSSKKPGILTNFCFLVNFIRHTGPMVTMGYQVHRWAFSANSGWNELGKKILRKNLVFWPTLVFWSILSDTLVPWSQWVNRYTGGLSQLIVVKMSWEKNSKKKPSILNNFCFLVNFIRQTGPMVTMGHQVHPNHKTFMKLQMTPRLWQTQLQLQCLLWFIVTSETQTTISHTFSTRAWH